MLRQITMLIVLTAIFAVMTVGCGGASKSASDPVTSSVSVNATANLLVKFSTVDPQAITSLQWSPSGNPANAPNLTNSVAVGQCDYKGLAYGTEFWGNSWTGSALPIIVGSGDTVPAGAAGFTSASNGNGVLSNSVASTCGPLDVGAQVRTQYVWDVQHADKANVISVQRSFSFPVPFTQNFRPYVPRLFSAENYSVVLHPDQSGTMLVTEQTLPCQFGCEVKNWNGSWFAIHNPTTGAGVIVWRSSSTGPAADLWLDHDENSDTASSSVNLLAPAAGFSKVTEAESLCFYDSTLWPASAQNALQLPNGCGD